MNDSPPLPPAPLPGETPFPLPPGQRPSSWPMVFGVVAVVFGLMGALGGLMNLVMSFFMTSFMDFSTMPSSQPPEVDEMMKEMQQGLEAWVVPMAVLHGLLAVLAVVLLIGGILLMNRRVRARPLLIFWSYAKIVVGVGAALVGYRINQGQMSAVMGNLPTAGGAPGGGPPMPQFESLMSIFSGVAFFFGVLFTCALPVLFLIWLNREAIRADIDTWEKPAGSGPV